jgi:cyanophycinase
MQQRSYLMLIGGAEDKKSDKTVLKKVVETAEPKNIVVIPTASTYPAEMCSNYTYTFKSLGVEEVNAFDIRQKDEVDKELHLQKLETAQLVFFTGGDQVKLFNALAGTRMLARIRERFYNGELCIAGTSAGAAVQSNPMIYDGDFKGFNKGSVRSSEGFGFLEGITIDTHFLNRERIPRLTQFIASGGNNRGIGICEDTGIFISPDLKFEVAGSGMVTLISADDQTKSDFSEKKQDEVFSISDLHISFLSHGAAFDLNDWCITDAPEVKKKLSSPILVEEEVVCPGSFI